MSNSLIDAFLISFDGSTKTRARITASSNDYIKYAPHALVKGELYIFGGATELQKIAKLEGCEWKEQPQRLQNRFWAGSAALSIENGSEALICFDDDEDKNCEVFDSTTSVHTDASIFNHRGGKLGFYKGQPTTVGGQGTGNDSKKMETLSSFGWSLLADFPSQIYSHILIGLPSESLLLAGGRRFDDGIYVPQTTIWLLQNDMWNQIGNLKNADWWESAIMINNSIFIVSGLEYPHTIDRLDFQGHHEIIGNTVSSHFPVLFKVSPDYCA